MKTSMVKKETITRKWYLLDAKGLVLGRAATQVAGILRGKGKPTFAPHLDGGDGVVVINSDLVVLTGKKLTQKFDFRYSGYPGGQTLTPYSILMKTKPEKAFTMAVKGMLPPNKLRDKIVKRLKVFKGADVPSEFKNAEKLEIRG